MLSSPDRTHTAPPASLAVPSAPFRRGRFDDLPAQPRLPHPYFATRSHDVTVTTAALGSVRTHVRIHGAGPPLLLIHGLMTTSYSWRYVLEPLGAHFTLYIPDLPGAGKTEGPLAPRYHPQAFADWIGELQRVLGIRGCAAIGNSMGGYLCMRLALSDGAAISRLVNLHSPGVPERRLYALRAVFAVPGARALLVRLVRRDPLRWVHRNVHYFDESLKSLEEAHAYGDPLRSRDGARAFVKHLEETMGLGPIRAFYRTLGERQKRGEVFPVPMQLLYARRDPMVPGHFGELIAARTGAPLAWIEDASHFAHVDAVERFVPPALAFLAG